MATPQYNSFTSFKFDDVEEELRARILTEAQKQILSNDLCEAAEAKLELKYDPEKHLEFIQQDAFLQAKIKYIQYLISASDTATDALIELARSNPKQ